MGKSVRAVRGTQDVLPDDSYRWQYAERVAFSVAEDFGYREMRTPVLERTELFHRTAGETTDVVQKETYTFQDRGGRSVTLRPEGTAGMARAVLEHGLHNERLPIKIAYLTSCYRYEKPQAGRLREFHQFGAECFGAASPAADAEVISLAHTLLNTLEVKKTSLHINSIGCPTCRAVYREALVSYFAPKKDLLCETCRNRLDRNPMRILDCKIPSCAVVAAAAPVMIDYLCDACSEHFDRVKEYLETAGVSYTPDPHIVRGLDYYTRTVFEFVSETPGARSVVCGGGRYDGLIEELGGSPLPSLGFGMGIERLLAAMEAEKSSFPEPSHCEVYFASLGESAAKRCFALVSRLREGGVSAECDTVGRGLKAQMRYADKIGARCVIVVGDDELSSGRARIKDMKTGKSEDVALDDGLFSVLYNRSLDRRLRDMTNLFGEDLTVEA